MYFYIGSSETMKKILVIQQKMIGDVLVSSILCEWLKKNIPESEVHYCIYEYTLPVVEHNPFIDEILLFKEEFRKDRKAFWQFLMTIKHQKYDLVVDAYGKLESGIISWFSRAPERISYAKDYPKFVYTKTIERSSTVYTNAGNAIEDRLRLLVPEDEIENNILQPKIYLTEEEREQAHSILKHGGIDFNRPIVMIGLLGSAEDKSLPDNYMATLIEEVIEKTNGQLIYNYTPSQKEEAQKIFDRLSDTGKSHSFFNIYGASLRAFMALLSKCTFLIGNEGGAVNMAKALNIPTFTLFSPWIHKKAWNSFEDGQKNVSVHLSDFEPEVYENHSMKDIKKEFGEWYRHFKPDYWLPALNAFIKAQLKN